MSEEMIVRHCSPTLAGMKTGNMFTCPYTDDAQLRDNIRSWNRTLCKKGLRVLLLRVRGDRALIYVYRPSKLKKDLQDGTACQLLQNCGYGVEAACADCSEACDGASLEEGMCVRQLIRRLEESEEFPHEIGLFLGYPPEDVRGFMEKRDCKYSGFWKVYGDVEAAKKTFAKFKKCTDVYCEQYAQGKSIDRLTIAG